MPSFTERFSKLLEERNSILSVGLDTALPEQRKENVIPLEYLDDDITEGRLLFCLDFLDEVAPNALIAKLNSKYGFGFSIEQHRRLTEHIRKLGLLSVLDDKLGDIGKSNDTGLFWLNKVGYDAVTVNTQAGNLGSMVKTAHGYEPEIGVLALNLMSNPESPKYYKRSTLDGKPVYLAIAEDIKETGADGSIVGATGHVKGYEIEAIRNTIGDDRIIYFPGAGIQGGDDEKAIRHGGWRIAIHFGRIITYSEDPGKTSKKINKRLNNLRLRYGR